MKRPICVWMAFLGVTLLGAPASAQWLDHFDGYTPGTLTTQSLWETWDQGNVDCDVVNNQSFTPGQSIRVDGTDDVIYDFVNMAGGRPTSGDWVFTVKTYVPGTATGVGYVLLLNDYNHGGPYNWSIQIQFDADNNQVVMDGASGRTVPLRTDEWVSVIVCIDLDDDKATAYYADALLLNNRSWKDGLSGGGTTTIAVVDLYGNTIDEFYMDNARLEPTRGRLGLSTTPNPITTGQTLNLTSRGYNIPSGSLGGVMSWTVNGNLFIQGLMFPFYAAGNRFDVQAVIPPGLSGLQVGLKSLAATGSGGLRLSNEDIIIFN